MHKSILTILILSWTACGATTPNEKPNVPGEKEPSCGRYEERIAGACHEVNVIGIEDRELSFERAGYTLHGTLTLPVFEGEYRPPVFVLVHGSGPNDRDETVTSGLGVSYGQKIQTFRMLAEALAGSGAAVFRYDKRTCFAENSEGRCPNPIASYPGELEAIRVDDFISDLREAVRAVAALPEVDGNDVTVVGHSQGANFVPLLMADEPNVVAGVQLAGASLPIDRVVVDQLREFADFKAAGGTKEADLAPLRSMADEYEDALSRIRAGTYDAPSFEGSPVAFWMNWMERTDHLEEEFARIDGPILLLNGDLDFNVAPAHLERFREWSRAAGKTNATFVVLPGVTHAFVTVTGGGRQLDPNFSPRALEELIGWHRGLATSSSTPAGT